MTKKFFCIMIALPLFAPNLLVQGQTSRPGDRYLILATSRTGTMEKELNQAGARGYRVVSAQSGSAGFGGDETIVIMALDPDGKRFRHILLATRTVTSVHGH